MCKSPQTGGDATWRWQARTAACMAICQVVSCRQSSARECVRAHVLCEGRRDEDRLAAIGGLAPDVLCQPRHVLPKLYRQQLVHLGAHSASRRQDSMKECEGLPHPDRCAYLPWFQCQLLAQHISMGFQPQIGHVACISDTPLMASDTIRSSKESPKQQ